MHTPRLRWLERKKPQGPGDPDATAIPNPSRRNTGYGFWGQYVGELLVLVSLNPYRYAHISAHRAKPLPKSETNTKRIIARLERDGWIKLPKGEHDKYEHPNKPGVLIVVPRHRELSPGVARQIARLAGWRW